jgi:hypothetical protein
VQFAAILIAHSHFLALLPKQSAVGNTLYFLFLVLSLALLGGLLENRRIFRMLESGRLIVSAAFVLAMGGSAICVARAAGRPSFCLRCSLSVGCLALTAASQPGKAPTSLRPGKSLIVCERTRAEAEPTNRTCCATVWLGPRRQFG